MFFKGSLLLKLSVDNLNCSTRFKTSAERKILQNMRFSMFISSQPIWGGRGCCLYWDLISLFVIYILFARKLLYALCFGAVCLCTNCVHYALVHYSLVHYACCLCSARLEVQMSTVCPLSHPLLLTVTDQTTVRAPSFAKVRKRPKTLSISLFLSHSGNHQGHSSFYQSIMLSVKLVMGLKYSLSCLWQDVLVGVLPSWWPNLTVWIFICWY